jgi:hypothetical protein
VRCESIVTTHAGHAVQETAALELGVHACIIAVGGDGLLHEILQVACSFSHSMSLFRASCIFVAHSMMHAVCHEKIASTASCRRFELQFHSATGG